MGEEKRTRGRKPGDDGTGNRGGGKKPVNGKAARVKINISIDPELLAVVDAKAADYETSRSDMINQLLYRLLVG